MFNITNLFKTKVPETKKTFQEVIAFANRETEEAMNIFVQARNRLVLNSKTINETLDEVKEAKVDLQKAEDMLVDGLKVNETYIANIDSILK